MAVDRNNLPGTPLPDYAPAGDERFALDPAEDAGRSNFAAFLLGGVVISGGLLAFLYYDTDNLNGQDVLTTGSLGRIETQQAPTPPPPALPKPGAAQRH